MHRLQSFLVLRLFSSLEETPMPDRAEFVIELRETVQAEGPARVPPPASAPAAPPGSPMSAGGGGAAPGSGGDWLRSLPSLASSLFSGGIGKLFATLGPLLGGVGSESGGGRAALPPQGAVAAVPPAAPAPSPVLNEIAASVRDIAQQMRSRPAAAQGPAAAAPPAGAGVQGPTPGGLAQPAGAPRPQTPGAAAPPAVPAPAPAPAGAGAGGGAAADGAGAGGGAMLAAAGPIGAAVAVAHMAKEKIEALAAASFKAAKSIAEFDAEGLARSFADLAKQVPVVGGVLGGLVGGILDLADGVFRTAQRLSEYNGALAVQMAELEVRQIQRDIRRAQELGPQLVAAVEARQEFQEKMQKIMDKLAPILIKAAELGMNALTSMVEIAAQGLRTLAQIADHVPGMPQRIRDSLHAIERDLEQIIDNTAPAGASDILTDFERDLQREARILEAGVATPRPEQPAFPGLGGL
jgi:hypothetical protein